jgi:hypothetical protein
MIKPGILWPGLIISGLPGSGRKLYECSYGDKKIA